MESPQSAPETPGVILSDPTPDDATMFACKGCQKLLEEGKAFELAGHRWHIDCFRCASCGELLDSDANLLLLGDGSLICSNCTYSCSGCGNKIEDLAILTGDQAFCKNCFKCRNCKRQIDNLRYAKTSQGIFCMTCHESLMARRRKKHRPPPAERTASSTSNGSGGQLGLHKSLPALPPHIGEQSMGTSPFTLDGSSDLPGLENKEKFFEQRERLSNGRNGSASNIEELQDPITLPARSYTDGQSTAGTQEREQEDEFTIPVALDPSPGGMPSSDNRRESERREYFGQPRHGSQTYRDNYRDLVAGSSRGGSRERSKTRGSPHIAMQEKGRKASTEIADVIRRRQESGTTTPASSVTSPAVGGTGMMDKTSSPGDEPTSGDKFQLQEAPKRKPSYSQQSSSYSGSPTINTGVASSPSSYERSTTSETSQFPKRKSSFRKSPLSSPAFTTPPGDTPLSDRPSNIESTRNRPRPAPLHPTAIKENDVYESYPTSGKESNQQKSLSKSGTSPVLPQIDGTIPARSPRRPKPSVSAFDTSPYAYQSHERQGSYQPSKQSTEIIVEPNQEETKESSSPIPESGTETGFEEEPAREYQEEETSGLFRKVSKAVRHGRSQSDRVGNTSPRIIKTPRVGSVDISSPISATHDAQDDDIQSVRNKLANARMQIAQLETEKQTLERKINGDPQIRQVNTAIREKRSTMAVLDSQREIIVRELEILTEKLPKLKNSKEPLDMEGLETNVMREFAASLERLKNSLKGEIEDLVAQKQELQQEISSLIQAKDKGLQEYDAISTRNADLVDHYNVVLKQIQEVYNSQKQGTPKMSIPSNGLGIYAGRPEMTTPITHDSLSQLSGETQVEQGQVIKMGKAQPKRFWKRGGQAVAKNVKSGFKGAFGSNPSTLREEQFSEGVPYNNIPAGDAPATSTTPISNRTGGEKLDHGKTRGWGWGNIEKEKEKDKLSATGGFYHKPSTVSISHSKDLQQDPSIGTESTGVFGSDLTWRCEQEKRVIPSVILACVSQVHTRGMEQDGIYRKSGSSIEVKRIQQGFERDPLGYDVSDEDLDIHAITGTLKQYLRKLPNPLITFETYDMLLSAAAEGQEVSTETKVANIRRVVRSLPRSHRDVLEFLTMHLVQVAESQSVNLMTPMNLAVVFAPTIMRPKEVERELTDVQAQRAAVQLLLDHQSAIFESSTPTSATES